MFGRVAALCFAAFLVAAPVASGVETVTFADAAASAAVNALDPPMPEPSPDRAAAITETAIEDIEDTSGAPVETKVDAQTEPRDVAHDTPPAQVLPAQVLPAQALPAQALPAQVAALDPAAPVTPPTVVEPFGLAAVPVEGGEILAKWRGVEADIRADSEILMHCRDSATLCPGPAQNFLAIVAEGRARSGRSRIGVINRAINLAIQPMSDMAQWGVPDRWSSPLETFTTGRGDCEDYAIAKYVALTAAGVDADDVKLVIVRDLATGQEHAVVAARLDGNWIMLDNRWLRLVEDNAMPQILPLFVLDHAGVKQFTSTALSGARRTAAPASLGF
jgi:predicted transglutaminase-like cysteine proteinase